MNATLIRNFEAELRTCFWKSRTRALVSAGVSAALVLAPVAPSAHALTRGEYEACQARDEAGFRNAIDALTLAALEKGLTGVDYKALVDDEWRRADMNAVIDQQVDQAIDQVREESSWGQLLRSLASKDKAQELATTVAERVYRSDAMKKSLEMLAAGAGRTLARRIEAATVDTAEPAKACMQAFLGPRYGTTVASVVSRNAGNEYAIDPSRAAAQISTGQVVAEGTEGIAGAVVLLVRRQLSNMAARVGQRLVGSVLGRLVSVVAGGVGLVLIAKDIWDFRHGVLPIIADEMKSADTKAKVREELAKSISEQIGDHLKDISGKTADRVVEIWQEFRRAHAKVLELAEKNPAFKAFLDSVKPTSMPAADEIVALVLAGEGEAGIDKRLKDGTLQQAVSSWPPQAREIARETRSIETAFQWVAVAGNDLQKVLDYEIYRRARPQDFSRASLQRLLDLQDRVAITRLAGLTPAVRGALFELEPAELKPLARALGESELDSLSRYLTQLDRPAGQRLLRAVAQTPQRMQVLGDPAVRDAIIASRDQSAAVSMMLRTSSVPDPTAIFENVRLVADGKVSPMLLWHKHPLALGGLGIGTLIILLALGRLLFGRRTHVVLAPERSGWRAGRRR